MARMPSRKTASGWTRALKAMEARIESL